MIRIIAAIDEKRGLAKDGVQPILIPSDLAYFREKTFTYGGNVLVGKNTYLKDFHARPLKGRNLFVLSSSLVQTEGIAVVKDIPELLSIIGNTDLWVAGGAGVFKQFVEQNIADELYLTEIEKDFKCDQFFPEYKGKYKLKSSSETQHEEGVTFSQKVYQRI
ncbi:MAG: dihydrofolate reductase [Candidatus Saccharimonadales bacterium]